MYHTTTFAFRFFQKHNLHGDNILTRQTIPSNNNNDLFHFDGVSDWVTFFLIFLHQILKRASDILKQTQILCKRMTSMTLAILFILYVSLSLILHLFTSFTEISRGRPVSHPTTNGWTCKNVSLSNQKLSVNASHVPNYNAPSLNTVDLKSFIDDMPVYSLLWGQRQTLM